MIATIVKLKEISQQIRGVSYKDGDTTSSPLNGFIPLLRANNINNNLIKKEDVLYVTAERVKQNQLLKRGDIIVVGSSGSIDVVGKAAIFEGDERTTFGAFCKVIRPDASKVIPQYLNYFFQTDFYRRRISFLARGANINNLKNEHLDDLEIPVPSIEIQDKIVAILNKSNVISSKIQELILGIDTLSWSLFSDSFKKLQGFNTVSLEVVANIVSGLTKGKKNTGKATRLIPYMRVANVQDGFLDLSEIKNIEATEEEAKRYALKKDDLLLTEGGDPDQLGRGCLWKEQLEFCIYQNHLFRVRVIDRNVINPVFLSYQVSSNYGKTYFLKAAKQTSGIASINSKQLKAFPVYIPPIELQNSFCQKVEMIESIKLKLQTKYTLANDLISSISQLSFSGKLNLNTAIELELLLENDYDFFKKNSSNNTIRLLLEKMDKHYQNEKKFNEESLYDKGKEFLFELLKEGKVHQVFDDKTKSVKLDLK